MSAARYSTDMVENPLGLWVTVRDYMGLEFERDRLARERDELAVALRALLPVAEDGVEARDCCAQSDEEIAETQSGQLAVERARTALARYIP